MKKTKVIIPALGILLLSTAASVTGTVAWFSANQNVTANGMNLKAKAEQGILISTQTAPTPASAWGATASALHNGQAGDPAAQVGVYPTSTADASAWYHNVGTSVTDGSASEDYEVLKSSGKDVLEADANGFGTAANGNQYYLLNTFYVKASNESGFNAPLIVNDVTASGSVNSVNLNKALRVLIKQGANSKIFAPFGGTLSYNVNGSATATDAVNASGAKENTELVASLAYPGISTTAPLAIDVYVYFEGEDENCKSENIVANLDTLNIIVQFGTANI